MASVFYRRADGKVERRVYRDPSEIQDLVDRELASPGATDYSIDELRDLFSAATKRVQKRVSPRIVDALTTAGRYVDEKIEAAIGVVPLAEIPLAWAMKHRAQQKLRPLLQHIWDEQQNLRAEWLEQERQARAEIIAQEKASNRVKAIMRPVRAKRARRQSTESR